jgi:hypothetical protein
MKYSILILIFVMSIFASANTYVPTNDLDKPFSGDAASTLAWSLNGDYFKSYSIQGVINFLAGLNYATESTGIWNQGWYIQTSQSDINEIKQLKTLLTNYVSNFPGVSQLLSATMANGVTTSLNMYNATTTESPAMSAGYQMTFYAGRNTSAGDAERNENNNKGVESEKREATATSEITIATGKRKYTIYAYDTTTPIVLDLDGDGELEASKGRYLPHDLCVEKEDLLPFDMNEDGFEELVEWVGENDGLLVHDIVNNEVSAKNFFGNATGYKDGFEQLATLDANEDGALTGEELAGLSVWQDKNRNAKIDAGEIHSLESLGITKLNVKAIELKATFERNGKYYMMWDWNPVVIMVKKNR